MNYAEMRKHIVTRKSALKNDLSMFLPHFRELNEYIRPRQARLLSTDTKQDRRNTKIIDNTATMSANTLAAGMMTGITNPVTSWFRMTTNNKDLSENQGINIWLDTVESRMREVFLKSNLYHCLPMFYADLGIYGTAALFVDDDHKDVLRCYTLPIGSYAIANSNRGNVDTLVRWFMLSVKQIVDQFGYENCSEQIKNQYDNKSFDNQYEITHYVSTNDWKEHGKVDAKNKAFISVYMESTCNDDKFLRVSGYDYFPCMVARWSLIDGDVYGDSPAMVALPDIKALQLTQKRKIEIIEKIARPPMTAPSSLRNSRASILPGDITYVDVQTGQQGYAPVYQVQPAALGGLYEDIQACQTRIKRAFFEDLFLMLASADDRQRTATEIVERKEEKMLVLGSVITRLSEELLNPLVDLAFDKMMARNMFPEPPKELQGAGLQIEYISILSQAQKMVGVNGLDRFINLMGGIANLAPSSLDKWDVDQTIDEYARMMGLPPKIIVSDDNVAKIRQQQQQAQAQQQQAAQAQQQAATMKDLSQSEVTDTNALGRLAQQMQGQTLQ
jgi:hypothetical protein